MVVDSTDSEGFSNIKEKLIRVLGHQQLQGVPVLIFAHKQVSKYETSCKFKIAFIYSLSTKDLPSALTADQISEKLSLNKLQNHKWHIQESSFTTHMPGLLKGFQWFGSQLKD